jgi:acetyl esterase/lipase
MRKKLYRLLGDLPARDRKISAKTMGREIRDGYVLEKLVLDLNGLEPVPAYFLKPAGLRGKAPAVLYNHYHGGKYKLGKDELLTPKRRLPSYAETLTGLGYCALCIDAWAFGERSTRTELDLFKEMLWQGRVLWGMMVYDSLRALDYLASRPEVDAARLATLGMSMGSTMAWWTAALDARLKVVVDICCLTDFDALIESEHLKGHGIYYYVPGLLKHFSAAGINGLIAPRAHLSLAGTKDPLTPVKGLDRIDRELRGVYTHTGHPDNWRLCRYPVAHRETVAMRREVESFLREKL